MEQKTKKWRSPSLGKDMELTVYGSSGTPIIGLPTRGAACDQWDEFGMIDAISYQLKNGFNQLYCLSSIDDEALINENASASQRLVRQQQYYSYVTEEVVPFIQEENGIGYTIVAGIDLGGYHAVTIALKKPSLFGKAIGISGIYDITQFLDGYYEDDVYYNNPMDFIPNLNKQPLLNNIRNVDFRLVTYKKDARKEQALRLSNVLRMKFIEHDLDVWGLDSSEEWDLWPQMLKAHII